MIYEVKNVNLSYPKGPNVVHNASLTLSEGETLTIIGPNGSGKSTFLNSLVGLHQPDSGEIRLYGKSILSMKQKEIANITAYVRQTQSTVFSFTVLDYVMMGRAPKISTFSRPKKVDEEIAYSALVTMGIEELAQRPYTDISGGQRQQATIARALAQEPKVILLDEPTSHLDFGNQIRIVSLVQKLSGTGYSVIMTTHDPNQAIMLGGKVAILDQKGDLTVGSTEKLVDEGTLCNLYNTKLKIPYVDEVSRNAVLPVTPEP